jgi:hypothetical protein
MDVNVLSPDSVAECAEWRQLVKERPQLIAECTQKAIASFCTKCGEPSDVCLTCKVAELSFSVGG